MAPNPRPPTPVPIPDGVRWEILLEKAPASKVMEFLASQYENVQFTPHPTMNGFYVYGSRRDVLQITSEVPNLDQLPEPAPPPIRALVAVKYADVYRLRSTLATLIPDAVYDVDTHQNTLTLTGSPGAIAQVRELVVEFDRPKEQVVLDCKLVDITESQRSRGFGAPIPRVAVLQRTPFEIASNLHSALTELISAQHACVNIVTANYEQRVRDGGTLMLGGLLPPSFLEAVDRIPLLAELPIPGMMFRSASSRRYPSEIVVMLTPHIMK